MAGILYIYNHLTNQLINNIYIRFAQPLTPYALYLTHTLSLLSFIFQYPVSTPVICVNRDKTEAIILNIFFY